MRQLSKKLSGAADDLVSNVSVEENCRDTQILGCIAIAREVGHYYGCTISKYRNKKFDSSTSTELRQRFTSFLSVL